MHYIPSSANPSCLQTMNESVLSHPSSHILLHIPSIHTSTLPCCSIEPSARRIEFSTQPLLAKQVLGMKQVYLYTLYNKHTVTSYSYIISTCWYTSFCWKGTIRQFTGRVRTRDTAEQTVVQCTITKFTISEYWGSYK